MQATIRAQMEVELTNLAVRGGDTALLSRLREFDPSWRRPGRRRKPPVELFRFVRAVEDDAAGPGDGTTADPDHQGGR